MTACPQCGAIQSADNASDRCDSCGSYIPRAGTVQPVWSESSHAESTPNRESIAPTSANRENIAGDDERDSAELIRPRNLSAEYAERVTEHWARTDAEFRHPSETIHSNSDTTEQEEDLQIGVRKVVNIEDGERGDYELSDTIGEGGMGVVWSARQSSLNRDVAIKYPKRKSGQTEQQKNKFIFEVVVTGRLDHPNIVPIYDLARDTDGQLFYAMKRVDGRPWNTCIHDGSLTFEQNVEILMKVCDAIRFAHDRDVIHCDIKPHNIMVGRYGEVSVMDFGAAVRLVNGVAVASAGGTFSYMAPEIASDSRGQLCPATDVYLLGAVLYEIITGDPPHPPPADSKDRAQMYEAASMIAARNEILPISSGGELAEIAHKALATDISDRYQRVDDFQLAIRNYLSHAESIALADRGQQHLRNATDESHGSPKSPGARFDEFDRARFAFEEAVTLWSDNEPAKRGLAEAIFASAKYALREGAYSRGIALLDRANPDHEKLLSRLHRARYRTERQTFLLRTAATTIIVGGVTMSLVLSYLWYQAKQSELRATQNEQDAIRLAHDKEKLRKAEELAKFKAEDAQFLADLNAFDAEISRQNAIWEKQRAESNEEEAERQKVSAERSSYTSEIGIAEKALQRNSFDQVRNILTEQLENVEKRPLRDWEWGHLNHRATADNELYRDLSQRFETAAISDDGRVVIAGSIDGQVYVWLRNPAGAGSNTKPLTRLTYGVSVHAVEIARRGDAYIIAAAGVEFPRSTQHRIKLWQLNTNDEVSELDSSFKHNAPIFCVDISHDARKVLSSGADGTARLWSLGDSGPPVVFYVVNRNLRVSSANFSPDEKWVVTAADDRTVRIWSSAGKEQLRYTGHNAPVLAAGFSQDGKFVVSGDRDGRLLYGKFNEEQAHQWQTERRKEIESKLADENVELPTYKLQRLGEHAAAVESLAFSTDGRNLFSSGNDNTVCVWDIARGFGDAAPIKTLRGHGGWVHACDPYVDAQDRSRVLSAGYDGRVLLWDWEAYESPRVLALDSKDQDSKLRLTCAAASPDAEWIATGSENGLVTIWDMRNASDPKSQVLREGHEWQANSGAFFDNGRRLLTSGGDNTTLVWDAKQGKELLRLGNSYQEGTGWRGVSSISHNGQIIATGSNPSQKTDDAESSRPILAKLWDAHTGALRAAIAGEIRQLPSGPEVSEATAIDFSPDNEQVVVGHQWGLCSIFHASTGKLLNSFAAHDGSLVAIRFLPDGQMLLTAAADGRIRKWDLSSDPPQRVFQTEHGARIVALDITSDGHRIISAGESRLGQHVVRQWNADTGEPLESLTMESILASFRLKFGDSKRDAPYIRSVKFHPRDPVALITVYDPKSLAGKCQLGQWSWSGSEHELQPIAVPGRAEISMALYSPRHRDRLLVVGGRGARYVSLGATERNQSSQPASNMTFRPLPGVTSLSFSSDGSSLACAGSDGSIKFWELGNDRQWHPGTTLPAPSHAPITSIQADPSDSNRFVTASVDGVRLLHRTGEAWTTKTIEGPQGENVLAAQAVFSKDGRFLVIATLGQGVLIVDRKDNSVAKFTDKLTEGASCVAILGNGPWVAISSGTRTWLGNLEQKSLVELSGAVEHPADITSLCFSPNGKRLFTGSQDFTVKVWDVSAVTNSNDARSTTNAGPSSARPVVRELMTLSEHQGFVTSVQFFGNQETLLTTSLDGQAILWPCKMK